MAALVKKTKPIEYPTSDGKPMAETEWHRILMIALIDMLQYWYADVPNVCVSGNLLMYYVPGDKRRHVSPDVFVAFGVPKRIRDYYLTWEEKKNPSVIIELTSSSTRMEDIKKKFVLYRDTLKVKEYFLFDPRGDYLEPRLRGFRLRAGEYEPIALVNGRMPSKQLELHLETDGRDLWLYDPATETYLPTPIELFEREQERADQEKQRADQEKQRADEIAREKDALAEENLRLRQQLENLSQPKKNGH
jgi:Uma2 family endonuclease